MAAPAAAVDTLAETSQAAATLERNSSTSRLSSEEFRDKAVAAANTWVEVEPV